jgi:hypothetical protein
MAQITDTDILNALIESTQTDSQWNGVFANYNGLDVKNLKSPLEQILSK